MINWRLDPTAEKGGRLTLFDCSTGAMFMIQFKDPAMLRRMLGDILSGTEDFDEEPTTPLPEVIRREFPGRD